MATSLRETTVRRLDSTASVEPEGQGFGIRSNETDVTIGPYWFGAADIRWGEKAQPIR